MDLNLELCGQEGFHHQCIFVSSIIGDTTDHAQSVSTSAEIYCAQSTSHISFWIFFKLCKWLAMARTWPPYYFGSPGVKIMLMGVKKVKKFDYFYVQAIGHSFFQIYFIFGAWIGGYEISLGSK